MPHSGIYKRPAGLLRGSRAPKALACPSVGSGHCMLVCRVRSPWRGTFHSLPGGQSARRSIGGRPVVVPTAPGVTVASRSGDETVERRGDEATENCEVVTIAGAGGSLRVLASSAEEEKLDIPRSGDDRAPSASADRDVRTM
ncbi:hypothetical protein AAFF_G00105490 [Aldrovandia affinis]|uniref:Uncharacterized protein n=1 Tax=Aldrovandia affinis TaxID=143900 RepID=A0AAD7T202_9TELE|nr:hypothetical protein AAFF_G00105490 [Aldrovandia affinis]